MREKHSDENIFIAYQVSRDHYPVLNETYRSFHGYCPQALLPDNYLDAFRVQKCERQKRRNNCYHRFAAGRRRVTYDASISDDFGPEGGLGSGMIFHFIGAL